MLGIEGPLIYVIIFVGKLLEVSVATLRIMFVGKGKKRLGAACGLVEAFLWILIAGEVISKLAEDPIRAVVYCVAFTIGIVMGIMLEGKLAIGMTSMQIVSLASDGEKLGLALRENGFGVTILDGHSVDGTKRELIFVQLKRRSMPECERIVHEIDPDALISVSDVKNVIGGYHMK